MMAYTHVAFGLGCYTVSSMMMNQPPTFPELIFAAVGSLLPDLDHPRSFAGRRLWFISIPLSSVVGHRGITHSCIAMLAFTLLAIFSGYPEVGLMSALSLGYLSHIFGDWLTPSGIPFLWPSRRKFVSPIPFPTGGLTESVFFGVLLILLAWYYGLLPLHILAGFR